MQARSKLSTLSRCHFDLDQTSKAVGIPHYDIRQHRSFIPTAVIQMQSEWGLFKSDLLLNMFWSVSACDLWSMLLQNKVWMLITECV